MDFDSPEMIAFRDSPIPQAGNGYNEAWGDFVLMNTALMKAIIAEPEHWLPLVRRSTKRWD